MIVVIGGILFLRLHAFLALLLGALLVSILTPTQSVEQFALDRGMSAAAAESLARTNIGERVAQGFGRTCGQIGIIIAMASIIGTCLLKSGAADRIVRTTLKWLGERRAPLSFMGSGFLLGIPVFFDTVFYLMIPLGKAMYMRTGRNYLLYVLSIVAGATMAHSLVPPTPGPLFIANELGVDLGLMILAGCVLGAFTASAGYAYAHWASRTWAVPLRESKESLLELAELSKRDDSELPPVWLAVLPILLPVALIAARTGLDSMLGLDPEQSGLMRLILNLGDKNIALILAAIIALLVLVKNSSGEDTIADVRGALSSAGVIILITSSGGAFGNALQQTGIGNAIQELSTTYQISVLPLAFFLTTMVRTAQGSATVAMITAAGIFSGMADPAQLGFHPVYLCLAVGCGSKPIWWMNDSGFWVVTQMSGMTEKESLKTLTPMNLIMGLVGLAVTMLLAELFPLI